MNDTQENYFTFTFYVDPDLNDGYTEAFKQGDEPWWWYTAPGKGPAAGPVPNFAGAVFKSLYQWDNRLL